MNVRGTFWERSQNRNIPGECSQNRNIPGEFAEYSWANVLRTTGILREFAEYVNVRGHSQNVHSSSGNSQDIRGTFAERSPK